MNATFIGEENMESPIAAALEVTNRFYSTFWKCLPGLAIDNTLKMANPMM
jgi:hypothetical protein